MDPLLLMTEKNHTILLKDGVLTDEAKSQLIAQAKESGLELSETNVAFEIYARIRTTLPKESIPNGAKESVRVNLDEGFLNQQKRKELLAKAEKNGIDVKTSKISIWAKLIISESAHKATPKPIAPSTPVPTPIPPTPIPTSLSNDHIDKKPFISKKIIMYGILSLLVIVIIFVVISITPTSDQPSTDHQTDEVEMVINTHEGEHIDVVTGLWVEDRFDDGLFPQTRHRKLVYEDLEDLTSDDMKIMRNEIFARHGYDFQTADMKAYFNRQSWYTSRGSRSISLSEIEQYNVNFIKKYE